MPVKIFCVAGFLAWVVGGVWAEEKGTEEKKKENVKAAGNLEGIVTGKQIGRAHV